MLERFSRAGSRNIQERAFWRFDCRENTERGLWITETVRTEGSGETLKRKSSGVILGERLL